MKQNYSGYTEEDHNVWSVLFKRQMELISDKASKEFLNGVKKLGFREEMIPDFESVNKTLGRETGWEVIPADGIVPAREFFELLSAKKFPSTTWIRKADSLDYIEEPDIFHDTFGHLPMLANPEFCRFLKAVSDTALGIEGYDWDSGIVSSIYWFTVEFGLVKEDGLNKLYGAGILSSIGETKYAWGETPAKLPFDLKTIFSTEYRIDNFQERYFVIDSFEQLFDCPRILKDAVLKEMREREKVAG